MCDAATATSPSRDGRCLGRPRWYVSLLPLFPSPILCVQFSSARSTFLLVWGTSCSSQISSFLFSIPISISSLIELLPCSSPPLHRLKHDPSGAITMRCASTCWREGGSISVVGRREHGGAGSRASMLVRRPHFPRCPRPPPAPVLLPRPRLRRQSRREWSPRTLIPPAPTPTPRRTHGRRLRTFVNAPTRLWPMGLSAAV
ncbi:hypothetical protein B0H14DRAFT_3600359 [Mycena olivaceomarginata]|nr:hypothetical protein B0H14DRAFT_3600359 [Mycena olivaceomarginata]